jgi:hypothetical protein
VDLWRIIDVGINMVPISVKEEHDDADILGLPDDDIMYHVLIKFHNIAHN